MGKINYEKMQYGEKFLVCPEVAISDTGLSISALGETITFSGNVFTAHTNAELDTVVSLSSSDVAVLSPECKVLKNGRMDEYKYFDGTFGGFDEMVIAETGLCGIGVFLRTGGVSFFLSLDFPYSRIDHDKDKKASIGVDPLDPLKAGQTYTPHTLSIGAVCLSGNMSGRYDRAEIEAFSEYIQARMPKNFNGDRPIYSSACITNRMTDVREGRIFWSMYDNPTLTLDPETLKKEVRMCAELGIEYYQLFEGYYDWEEDGSSEKALKEIVALGKSLGVRVGDYMTPLELNCWHYNYHDRVLSDPEMCALLEEDYKNGTDHRRFLCYGSEKTVDYLLGTIVESIKRNGEEIICLDGNALLPCFDESHGHNKGSVYSLVRGLVRVMKAMNETSPYFLTWSNSGNWLELCPKLVWFNPNVYLTDPHPRDYSSSLNCLKYYGDCRREQMVSVHERYFVPYVAFCNCEYYAFRHSRVDDMAFFEYSFLQGLAVTPNICLGEMRTFLERVQVKHSDYVGGFIKKWLKFIKDNIDYWKYVYRVGDEPGVGANECYAHVKGDRGFICLVNQDAGEKEFTFCLDGSIGLEKNEGKRYLLSEIYPRECPIAEQTLPGSVYGENITLSVPAYSVRFIKIEPYFEAEKGFRLYGIPADTIDVSGGKYTLGITDYCGKRTPAALWINDKSLGGISVKTVKNVPKYFFGSSLESTEISGNAARFTLHFPRERFNREITDWSAEKTEKCHLSSENSDFCGGYIHNMYDELQRCELSFSVNDNQGKEKAAADDSVCEYNPPENVTKAAKIPRRASVYEAEFDMPFMEWPNVSNLYGFDEVIELIFSDCNAVKAVRAFINGLQVPVYEYVYAVARHMRTWCIELVGNVSSGTRPTIRIEVDWTEDNTAAEKTKFADKKTETVIGEQVVGM